MEYAVHLLWHLFTKAKQIQVHISLRVASLILPVSALLARALIVSGKKKKSVLEV